MTDAQIVKMAKALADPTRVRMLRAIIKSREMTCSEVGAMTAKRQPTVSHHLQILAEAGLLSVRREGSTHYLTADRRALASFRSALGMTTKPARPARAAR